MAEYRIAVGERKESFNTDFKMYPKRTPSRTITNGFGMNSNTSLVILNNLTSVHIAAAFSGYSL